MTPKILLCLLLFACLAAPATAQESAGGSEAAVQPGAEVPAEDDAAAPGEEGDEADESDDSDLDEQTYEEDDDIFVPTEEIPADEPIPFPSNI